MTDQSGANAYLRTKVLSASPEELRMMLLDASVRYARQAAEALKSQEHEAIFEGFTKCRDVVLELLNGIRDEPDAALAERVRSLYVWLYKELVEASMHRDAARLDAIIKILEYERETWDMLMKQLAAEKTGAARPAPAAAARLGVNPYAAQAATSGGISVSG